MEELELFQNLDSMSDKENWWSLYGLRPHLLVLGEKKFSFPASFSSHWSCGKQLGAKGKRHIRTMKTII